MPAFASKIYRTRNLTELDNSVLVEWRILGYPPESALCGSVKVLNRLIRRLHRQGFIHVNRVWFCSKINIAEHCTLCGSHRNPDDSCPAGCVP